MLKIRLSSNCEQTLMQLKSHSSNWMQNIENRKTIEIYLYLSSTFDNITKENFKYSTIEINDSDLLIGKNDTQYHVIYKKDLEFWELEQVIKIIISRSLINLKALVFHGSIINNEGVASVFIGPSGAGKSTIVELHNTQIFQDDTFGILVNKDCFEIFTIPFRRDYINKSEVVRKFNFYRIYQSRSNHVKDINNAVKLMHLLTGVWSFDILNNKNNNKIINLCQTILQKSEIAELFFSKDKKFLDLIY